MRHSLLAAAAVAACAWAAPAFADPSPASIDVAPSSREVQKAVDAYLASGKADASLVGGPGGGGAGYDNGFWIGSGSRYLLKINLTLQARWEGFDWADDEAEAAPGGDLSGFSLPRATLKFSGDATCGVSYYLELESGHHGFIFNAPPEVEFQPPTTEAAGFLKGSTPSLDNLFGDTDDAVSRLFGILDSFSTKMREAWIQYETSPYAIFRMGLIKTATTRQLMTPPEMQQFVDVSLASAFIGHFMPGWSDRNRDYGIMLHGGFGCDSEFTYLLTVTNGDGAPRRNVIDGTTSDDFAYSARVNWDVKGHLGYEEGALRQHQCEWALAVGAWGHYYADHQSHRPFHKFANRLTYGVDAAFGWGGLSVTAAYSMFDWTDTDSGSPLFGAEPSGTSYLFQVGYLFPGTSWEIAARYSAYTVDTDGSFGPFFEDVGATEIAGAVTYYIDGHSDKVTLDVAFITPDDDGNLFSDVYPGYNATGDSDAVLVRLQWQLAL